MIVIGDCHGCYNELMELLKIIPQNRKLCFVGDLIDRGPDSKKVVDFVKNNNHLCVKGNHEDFVSSIGYDENYDMVLIDRYLYDDWILNGGKNTFINFNNDLSDYIEWFSNLPLMLDIQNKQGQQFIISHSYAWDGLNTNAWDVLWERDLIKSNSDKLYNYINIFGHTPHKKATQYHKKHWCIDTGCFHTGILTGIDLNDMKIYTNKKE